MEEGSTWTIIDWVRKLASGLAGKLAGLEPRDKGRLGAAETGAETLGQASRGRQAARPYVGQAGGDRDRHHRHNISYPAAALTSGTRS